MGKQKSSAQSIQNTTALIFVNFAMVWIIYGVGGIL